MVTSILFKTKKAVLISIVVGFCLDGLRNQDIITSQQVNKSAVHETTEG
jgi:hypothetical protein